VLAGWADAALPAAGPAPAPAQCLNRIPVRAPGLLVGVLLATFPQVRVVRCGRRAQQVCAIAWP
jgi:hypothetical protein